MADTNARTDQHTPEPWRLNGIEISGANGAYIGFSNADRRRIVACVNACAGIPTEALENGSVVLEQDDSWPDPYAIDHPLKLTPRFNPQPTDQQESK